MYITAATTKPPIISFIFFSLVLLPLINTTEQVYNILLLMSNNLLNIYANKLRVVAGSVRVV
jgi:hypothetical protein